MSKKIRDYLFIIFIVIFVIATIIVSVYASGYKLNLSWPLSFNRLLIKTGMLVIDTKPSGATVYLNNEIQSAFSLNPWKKNELTTATKVKNIIPGEYDLKLELDGYWAFQKKIKIQSNQTTFLENINLFKNNDALLIAESSRDSIALSPNDKYLYLNDGKKIITIKTGQEKKITIENSTDCSNNGEWLKTEDKLLINGLIIDPVGEKDIDYRQLIGKDASGWHYDESSDRLYFKASESLSYFDLNKKNITQIANGANYVSCEGRDDYLFLIESIDDKIALKKYSLKENRMEKIIDLPGVGQYQFVAGHEKFLTIYDEQNKTLYLINPDNDQENKTIHNIASWQWLDDKTLFYNNEWEIYSLDLEQNNNTLITRFGEKIEKIIWNEKNKYLIFSTEKSLNAIELEFGAITTILKTEQLFSPVLDKKNDILYFWGKTKNQEGIYKILLK